MGPLCYHQPISFTGASEGFRPIPRFLAQCSQGNDCKKPSAQGPILPFHLCPTEGLWSESAAPSHSARLPPPLPRHRSLPAGASYPGSMSTVPTAQLVALGRVDRASFPPGPRVTFITHGFTVGFGCSLHVWGCAKHGGHKVNKADAVLPRRAHTQWRAQTMTPAMATQEGKV